MDLTSLYLENKSFIENCAKQVVRKYRCENILEDLISVGTIVFLERAGSYDEQQGAGITTFLYRYISGARPKEALSGKNTRMICCRYITGFKFPRNATITEKINLMDSEYSLHLRKWIMTQTQYQKSYQI